MEKARKEHEKSNISPAIFTEYQLWEDHWIRYDIGNTHKYVATAEAVQFLRSFSFIFLHSCSKELNQWEPLTEYGQSKGHSNPYLVLECAWRVSNWGAMKEALVQVRTKTSHWSFSKPQFLYFF